MAKWPHDRVGDGGFQLNIQELQTIVHHRYPVKIFVINNNGYHAIRVTQENHRYVASTEGSGVSCRPGAYRPGLWAGIPPD